MLIIFCSDVFKRTLPDPAYAAEWAAAQQAGFATVLLHLDLLVDEGDSRGAIRSIPAVTEPAPALYRGWMLRSGHYQALQHALATNGYTLITNVTAYVHTHEFPQWYPLLADHTPRSVWLPWTGAITLDAIMERLAPLGNGSVIVKDYVKSRKHEWADACFIPDAQDHSAVERVVWRFVDRQGAQLTGGLVFREFVPFAPIGTHVVSGMPRIKEYRLFLVDGQVLAAFPAWDAAYAADEDLPLDRFSTLAQQVQSRFFTMDVAQTIDGSWLIVELGDGQVAGLPDQADVGAFYRHLKRWADRSH